MEKTEWATESKLEELREQGIVSYSRMSTACLRTLMVFIVLLLFRAWATDFLALCKEEGRQLTNRADFFLWNISLLKKALAFFVAPAVIVTASTVIWGLLQTKFFFNPGLCSFDLNRLSPFRAPRLKAFVAGVVGAFFSGIIALGLGVGVVWLSCQTVLSLLNYDRAYFVAWPGQLKGIVLPTLFMALFIGAIVAFIVEKVRFRFAHRMTKAEVERGQRAG